jgi:non-specific serine/threonine protein kinase
MLLLQLFQLKGADYFETIRNWDREKNKLLALYGYSLSDDIRDKFEFTYHDGKPFLKVLDPSIQKVNGGEAVTKAPPIEVVRFQSHSKKVDSSDSDDSTIKGPQKTIERYGLVIQQDEHNYPYLSFHVVRGEANEEENAYVGKVEKIDILKFVTPYDIQEEDKALLQTVRKLQPVEMTKYLNKNSPFQGIWDTIVHADEASLPDETKELMQEYLHPKMEKVWRDLSEHPFVFFVGHNKTFTTANLIKSELVFHPVQPSFKVEKAGEDFIVHAQVILPNGPVKLVDNHAKSYFLFQQAQQFFYWKNRMDINWVEQFLPKGFQKISAKEWPNYLQSTVLPLSKNYAVALDHVSQEKVKGVKPQLQILLKENGDYLFFVPLFVY